MRTYIKQINGSWYAFAGDREKRLVYAVGKRADPVPRPWTNEGIMQASMPCSSRKAAYNKAIKHGVYSGDDIFGSPVKGRIWNPDEYNEVKAMLDSYNYTPKYGTGLY